MTIHPTDEALADLLDDPSSPQGDHVAGCGDCADRVAGLRAAAEAVRSAPGLDAQVVAAAVAAALRTAPGSGDRVGDVVPIRRPPSTRPKLYLGAAVAAAVAVLVGIAVLGGGRPGSRQQTAANDATGGATLKSTEAAALDGGDLGDVDQGTLDARVRSSLVPEGVSSAAQPGADTVSPFSAEGPDEAGSADPNAEAKERQPQATPPAPLPGAAPTRPARTGPVKCLAEGRAFGGDALGPLAYRADARLDGRPVVVVGFRVNDAQGRPTRYMVFVYDTDCGRAQGGAPLATLLL